MSDPLLPPAAGFTVAALARRWRVGQSKIRDFLRRGELVGFSVAANPAGKPQWRVSVAEVEKFEQRRTSAPPPRPARRRRKRTTTIDFYP
jgi:hypothetical protein